MKKYSISFIAMLLWVCASIAQQKLPSVNVKTLDGKAFNTENIKNDGKPIVINFWATWCKPCVQELVTISEEYENWQKETGVKIYAVSIDDARNAAKVPQFVSGKEWTYEILLDPNQDFKRALNVNNPPHTFLLNSKGEIVWQHNNYSPGDEKKLYEAIKKVANGEDPKH